MSGEINALPPAAAEAVRVVPKPPLPESTASAAPRPIKHQSALEHHPAAALSPSDISYVEGLMGLAPAETMEYIMLKTGVPVPANLGQDIDTSV